MDGGQFDLIRKCVQPQIHRLLPGFSSGDHGDDLVHVLAKPCNGQDQVIPGDDDDLRDGVTVLKRPHRPDDHGLTAQLRHDLVNPSHP